MEHAVDDRLDELAPHVGGELLGDGDDAGRIDRVPDRHVDADGEPLDALERRGAVRARASLRAVDLVAEWEETEGVDAGDLPGPAFVERRHVPGEAVRPHADLARQDGADRFEGDEPSDRADERHDREEPPAPLRSQRLEDAEQRRPRRRPHEDAAPPKEPAHRPEETHGDDLPTRGHCSDCAEAAAGRFERERAGLGRETCPVGDDGRG